MKQILDFLVLPAEVSVFERGYLARVNRIALSFFMLHIPAFVLIAWLNHTGPALAALLTSAVVVGPVLAQLGLKNARMVSVVYGVTAMFMGGLLVHFGQGPMQIEMHFYFFALLAMCAVFGNPMVVVAATVTVALHHALVWLYLPRSVFNYTATWWVVAVHASFVVLESVASCFIARSFFDNVIGLEKIVQLRTQALDEKNRDMRVLLDNVQQGFLTIDRRGRLAQQRSAAVDAWFGAPTADASWFQYLGSVSATFAWLSELAFAQVTDDFMPTDVALAQMPGQLTVNSAHYRFVYRAIGSDQPQQQFLVIVTDVTTQVEREHAEQERHETFALFEHLLNDRAGFESFFEESGEMLDRLVDERTIDPNVVKRMLHTLKGNAGLYGLQSLAQLCHELEDHIAEERRLPSISSYRPLQERWARLSEDARALLGTRSKSIEIDNAQFSALEAAARSGEAGAPLLRRIGGLKLEATGKRLQLFQRQAQGIAERLGKTVRVDVEDNGVRVDPKRWGGFWGAFVHAVRNALDHGIELDEDRALAGKTAPGSITLRTLVEKDQFVVEIADNGRGIDWELVAHRAELLGLPTKTSAELQDALFVDGLSTAATVTDVSGRGVGMGALLAATRVLDGELGIRSEIGKGTTLHFAFPVHSMRAESLYPVASAQGAE